MTQNYQLQLQIYEPKNVQIQIKYKYKFSRICKYSLPYLYFVHVCVCVCVCVCACEFYLKEEEVWRSLYLSTPEGTTTLIHTILTSLEYRVTYDTTECLK